MNKECEEFLQVHKDHNIINIKKVWYTFYFCHQCKVQFQEMDEEVSELFNSPLSSASGDVQKYFNLIKNKNKDK